MLHTLRANWYFIRFSLVQRHRVSIILHRHQKVVWSWYHLMMGNWFESQTICLNNSWEKGNECFIEIENSYDDMSNTFTFNDNVILEL